MAMYILTFCFLTLVLCFAFFAIDLLSVLCTVLNFLSPGVGIGIGIGN